MLTKYVYIDVHIESVYTLAILSTNKSNPPEKSQSSHRNFQRSIDARGKKVSR